MIILSLAGCAAKDTSAGIDASGNVTSGYTYSIDRSYSDNVLPIEWNNIENLLEQ